MSEEGQVAVEERGSVDHRPAIALVLLVGLITVGIIVFTVLQISGSEDTFTAETRDRVVDFCVEAGGDDDLCGCVADRVEELPEADFRELDDAVGFGNEPAKDIEDLVVACSENE